MVIYRRLFMEKAILLLLLIIMNVVSFGQQTVKDPVLDKKLFKPYEMYFQGEREWVYTHLNKSMYFQGDDIWFTSYVLNPTNKRLNFNTSKLYVELWSPEKNLLSRKILFVKEGTTNHYIHLPDTLAPGSYCFRTYTNWMRNFYPEKDMNSVITIVGQEKMTSDKKVKQNSSSGDKVNGNTDQLKDGRMDYDVQFLPESGTFLEGTNNKLGVKATDQNGKGVRIEGKVFTADNSDVTTFSTNEYGMSSFTIPETTNQKYFAKVVLPDSTIRDYKLPDCAPLGVIIHAIAYRPDVVWFELGTNQLTHKLKKSYLVMIHANGVVFGSYRLMFSKENVIRFKMRKDEMASGIIYVTVFDENLTPVAERIFYNQDLKSKGNLTLNAEALPDDTVKVNVHITDTLAFPGSAKLSISVLPGETNSSHFSNSLRSESILRPALRGNIENPDSYFEKDDNEHALAIENLMLTQGWRKYDWPAVLNDTIHKPVFPFEDAFTVKGEVKNWLKNKAELKSKISLLSAANNLYLTTPVDNEGRFEFSKLYLADSTWVVASASSDKGKNWNRALQMTIPESIMDTPDIQQLYSAGSIQQSRTSADKAKNATEDIPLQLTKGVIHLEEVVVTGNRAKPFVDNIYVNQFAKIVEITKDNYKQYDNMEMLLRIKFNVTTESGVNGYFFNCGRGALSIASSAETNQPIMIIDEMRIYDAQQILDLPLEYVEAVSVNKDGFGGGIGASGGVISVQLRKTPFFVNDAESTNMKRLMVHGYAAPIKYFEPKYDILPGTVNYSKYAAIFWKPDLIIGSNNINSFKFHVSQKVQSINVRVEGISFEGKAFLLEQKLVIPGKNGDR